MAILALNLRARNIQHIHERNVMKSRSAHGVTLDQILDIWLYSRASKQVIGRASAANFNGSLVEVVEPVWMLRPVPVAHLDSTYNLAVRLPESFLSHPDVVEFLAGGNKTWVPHVKDKRMTRDHKKHMPWMRSV